jgi:hypothetical protein
MHASDRNAQVDIAMDEAQPTQAAHVCFLLYHFSSNPSIIAWMHWSDGNDYPSTMVLQTPFSRRQYVFFSRCRAPVVFVVNMFACLVPVHYSDAHEYAPSRIRQPNRLPAGVR